MPFTSVQQDRLNAAQVRNDLAKKNWQLEVQYWTDKFINLKCYKDVKHDVYAAATWFTPTDSSCTSAAGCTSSDKNKCQDQIKLIRDHIGTIRAAYAEFQAAQQNYDQVFNEVTEQVKNDPAFQNQQTEIIVNAAANKLKWVFWITVVLVAAGLTYAYFKWFRK